MIDLSWTAVPWLLALAAVVAERLRSRRSLLRLRVRNEALEDEIWQVQAAMEARRRAEAASEAKSRFIATVSHEVRTPLNGILGIADLLQGTSLDREQLAYVEAVKTSGQALASLIDEILDFSRIEAGKLDLASEPFELTPLIEGVIELLAPRAQGKGLEIAAFIDPALPRRVIGDPVRLRQVLMNLAGNAVKFTEAGGVGLRIDRTEAGLLHVSVSDTGPGIPPGQRETIFEEFEQGDGTATRRHGGTGLGLAISRRIVERMGSRLVLDDRPGGGSIFGFDVALASADEHPGRIEATGRRLPERRVLIGARSLFQAPFLAARLEAQGMSVVCADGEAAIVHHLGRSAGFDLVFIDCALGEREAERLLKAARDAGARRIYLLFSPYERRAFGQALVEGFDGWLVKPVRARSLDARIGTQMPLFAAGPRGSDTPAAPLRRTQRVLLAEDNEINALVAMTYLGRMGARAVHAADGRKALTLALAALRGEIPRFDTIIMDVSMPEIDGLEVARQLRRAEAQGGHPATPIVGLTAHAFAEERATFLQAGMDEVLTKPIDFARFSTALIGSDVGARGDLARLDQA